MTDDNDNKPDDQPERATTPYGDQIEPEDVRTALVAFIHYLTEDPLGLTATIAPAEDNGRMTAVLLAAFDIFTRLYPETREPGTIAALREYVAGMQPD